MKHPAEQKHFYRTAAAAAVIAAIASLSAPVWAASLQGVTSSIPAGNESAPDTLEITAIGDPVYDYDAGTLTVSGTTPGVYLTQSGQTITLRATKSVTIGDPDATEESSSNGALLIASSNTLSFSGESDAQIPMMYSAWPYTTVTGAPDGGSIDIESGVKGGEGGTIELGEGAVLIANAPDAKNPLTFTVNGDQNAVNTIVESSILTFGPNAKSDITLTGVESSFTGDFSASQGGKAVLNSIGTAVEAEKDPTTVMEGIVSADHGGSVTVNASDTLDVNRYIAIDGGSVTVNLTGDSVQASYSTSGQFGDLIAMVVGPGSSFKETTSSGVSVYGDFEGLGGSHSEISLGGSWEGDAYLTGIYPTIESTVDEEGETQIDMVPIAAASDMSVTVNGAWDGDALVMNTVYNAPGETAEDFEPEQATLSVTANGGWIGTARVVGEKARLNVTIAEKQADEDSFPVSIWRGYAQVSDHGTANVIVNDEWIGGATVSYAADDDNNQAAAAYTLMSTEDGTAETASDETETVIRTGAEDGVKSFTATVNGIWVGALNASGYSDSTVTVNQGGIWRYGSSTSRSAASSTQLQSASALSMNTVSETDETLTVSLLENDNRLSSVVPGYSLARFPAPAAAILTEGSHADVTVDGEWYGAAVLQDGSSMDVKIGKTGTWTYLAPEGSFSDVNDEPTPVNSIITSNVTVVGPGYLTPYSSGGMITAASLGGSEMRVTVDGTWTGGALASYWGSPFFIIPDMDDDPVEMQSVSLAVQEFTMPETGREAGVKSFDATINGSWVGSLYARAGSDTSVTVNESGVWRYDPDSTRTVTNEYNGGSVSLNSVIEASAVTEAEAENEANVLSLSNAIAAAELDSYSNLSATVDGKLYGGITAAGESTFDIEIGETGVWANRYPGDPTGDAAAGSVTTSGPFTVTTSAVKESGPVAASLSEESSGKVTVKGEWTGDASVTELSSLEVDIGKTGKWSFSPDNGTIKVLTADLPADTEPTDDQLETLEVPILATVGEGSTLTFRDSGEMTGSILVAGTGEKYAEEIEDEPIAVEMAALDDTESDTEPEAEIVKSQVNGVVDGHWNGSLYGSTGSVSKVEVASGGVWENSYKLLNDTVNASDGAEITVIDNGTLRGTVSAYGTDTLLDITVGEGGVWEVGNDLLTRTPGVAFAADDAKLTVTVNPGGTFKGDVLALNAAPAAVTSNGTWVGSAVADGTDLTVTDGGNWTGSVWAKNGGTASVTVTGTWTGMVKDPGLQTPRSYVLRQEAMARAEEAAAEDETQVMTLLAVSDTDSGAAATDTAIPVTLNGSGSVWNVTESGTVGSLNIDSGTVNFPTPASNDTFTGTTLTVNGDFTGNGGLFTMNTVLSNDAAATDKLIVKGNATGTAQMTFTNVGGTGAQTVDGIRVAVVEGNSDLTITKPAKNFLRAGPYIYQLKQVQNSWYLTSQKQLVFLPFTGDVDPENPSADDPSKGNTPEASDLPDIIPATPGFANHVIRPELGAYANNALASNTLFSMSLEERLGEAKYADAMRGKDGEKSGSFWIRAHGGHTRNGMEDGVLTTRGNWGVMQVGGDVISWPTSGSHRFHAGLMAGYAHESSRTTSPDAGYSAKGKVSGYSVGLYGTWMNEKSDGTGPYADVWAQWQRFKNKVSASSPDTVSYHAKGFTLSFEGGYAFGLKDWKSADGADNALRLQLQGQVIRMGVRDDGVIDAYGTSIEGLGAGNVRTRLGAKLYYQKANGEKGTAFKPFLALNWYHDTKAFGARFDGIADRIDGGRNTGEVKLGLEAKLRKNVNLWGSVGYEAGSESYRNVEALVGAKILF